MNSENFALLPTVTANFPHSQNRKVVRPFMFEKVTGHFSNKNGRVLFQRR